MDAINPAQPTAPDDATAASAVAPPANPPSPLDRLKDVLGAIAPHLSADARQTWADAMMPYMRDSGMVTPRRIAMFCGQVAEESGAFTVLSENLNYTTPERICAVWPSRFPSTASALPYAHNPEALANRVYAGRLGNGDESSGDGWRFRGAGLIQLTGRALYTQFGQAFHKTPEEAAAWMLTPTGAAASACWYWSLRRDPMLNALADEWAITETTKVINGATTNLQLRIQLCNAALKVLGG